ncbi:Putative nicotinate phosphoribosyltransferase [uncultured archaeon]|nr:Putative nicotinate phosphoribosyltransferase [uncultured archaeon]
MALLADLYEFTMADAYVSLGKNGPATFDLFVRKLPPERGYLVAAGLADALEYVLGLKFSPESLSYLESLKKFSPAFLKFLSNYRFSGDIWAMPEGTVAFGNEPLMRITAPIAEAQILESFLLNCIGFQTMIASKAARVVLSARGKPVMDFSLRRDHGTDAGMKVARASYIAGFSGTSNVLAGKTYGIPLSGTLAHSFVLSFDDEEEAFRAWAEKNPENCVLIIDTFDTIPGARKAVKIGKELDAKGCKLAGVRIDSGDPVILGRRVRATLDEGGFSGAKIYLSGNLDECVIEKVLANGAPIDAFGVGTAMGVSDDAPSLDIIHKLAEATVGGKLVPVMKLSEGKATLPGVKQVFRREEDGKLLRDTVGLAGEKVDGAPLMEQFVSGGTLSRKVETLEEARKRASEGIARLPANVRRLAGPAPYRVDLSEGLSGLIDELKRKRM